MCARLITKTRRRVLDAIRRLVEVEGEASGATQAPRIKTTSSFPVTIIINDADPDYPRVNGSGDFSILATSIGRPSMFWFLGGS